MNSMSNSEKSQNAKQDHQNEHNTEQQDHQAGNKTDENEFEKQHQGLSLITIRMTFVSLLMLFGTCKLTFAVGGNSRKNKLCHRIESGGQTQKHD